MFSLCLPVGSFVVLCLQTPTLTGTYTPCFPNLQTLGHRVEHIGSLGTPPWWLHILDFSVSITAGASSLSKLVYLSVYRSIFLSSFISSSLPPFLSSFLPCFFPFSYFSSYLKKYSYFSFHGISTFPHSSGWSRSKSIKGAFPTHLCQKIKNKKSAPPHRLRNTVVFPFPEPGRASLRYV